MARRVATALLTLTLLGVACNPPPVQRPLEGAPVGDARVAARDEPGGPPTVEAPPTLAPNRSPSPAGSPAVAASPSPSPVPGFVIVATDGAGANLREEPSTSARVITTVAEGTAVEVYGEPITVEGRQWRRIRAAGRDGWVVAVVVRRR